MIKGFLFDLDGVITDTAKLHYLSWAKTVEKLGIIYTEEENEKLRGIPRLETLKLILKLKGKENDYTHEQLLELADEKNNTYVQLLKEKLDPSWLLPGIEQFLKDAKADNVKLSLASSSHNARYILDRLGITEYFDAFADPKNIKHGKPAPDIFIEAAKLINVDPEFCVGLEDALAGVEALNKANIRSIAFDYNSNVDFSGADLIYHNTSELDYKKVKDFFDNK
ncbi:beta-phosphoglucomutase [Mycoplasmopsis ciconiae]|uniref:Beta-phosphoglucomutase n=1 Tax=Mycoplasmopsis ciconiae TaxID=561067 RepID=A0ABU7ML82_9BACT|nr:beta-phosphoglucomutase [Mycoplasmopsis ciconiae]